MLHRPPEKDPQVTELAAKDEDGRDTQDEHELHDLAGLHGEWT